MSYAIRSVSDAKEVLWHLQDVLRDATLSEWTYVDGVLAGVAAVAADWDADVGGLTIVDGDYVVLQIPAAAGYPTYGVVQFLYNNPAGENEVLIYGHTTGWDEVGHTTDGAGPVLGTLVPAAIGGDSTELRVIANDNRAIILGMDAGFANSYFGYAGWIQTYYDDTDDPNPLMITGNQETPGDDLSNAPLVMATVLGNEAQYVAKKRVLIATDGTDMMDTMQWNRRENPPAPTRFLVPIFLGYAGALETEIRGELEGVFFYGPATTVSNDTVVARSDGQYLVIDDLVLGPIAPAI